MLVLLSTLVIGFCFLILYMLQRKIQEKKARNVRNTIFYCGNWQVRIILKNFAPNLLSKTNLVVGGYIDGNNFLYLTCQH